MAEFTMSRIGVIFLLFLLACPRKATRFPPVAPLSYKKEEVLRQLNEHSLPWYTARVRYQALYEGERKQTFQLRLCVIGDTLLWLSAGLMGIEGVRMLWRPDSLFILNRLSKEVYVGTPESLQQFLPAVGPGILFALLIGAWPAHFNDSYWEWDANRYTLTGEVFPYLAEAVLTLQPFPRVRSWHLYNKERGSLLLSYERPPHTPDTLSTRTSLTFPDGSHLTLLLKEIEWNPTDLAVPFSIPEGYTRKKLTDFSW
ncbi:MAG: DUF4292 domain-containing protein [Bacteroidia bacterium]|nr:DUF4292 domain-containing protein [Bacteroidia bacterium]